MGENYKFVAYSFTFCFLFFFFLFFFRRFFIFFFTLITAMYLNLRIALLMGVIAFATARPDLSAQVGRLKDEAEQFGALAVDEARQLNEEMEEFEPEFDQNRADCCAKGYGCCSMDAAGALFP